MSDFEINQANLDFFNSLSGNLDVELSESPVDISPGLANQKAPPTAKVLNVKLNATVYLEDAEDFRELTADELAKEVLVCDKIVLRSEGGTVTHAAPAGGRWSVADLIAAVEATERQTRGGSEWFGGVDVHHVYFEGIEWDGEAWEICWGS